MNALATVSSALKKAGLVGSDSGYLIIPDGWKPELLLKVDFKSGESVQLGAVVSPYKVMDDVPEVRVLGAELDELKGKTFTVACVDPDAPLVNPDFGLVRHWTQSDYKVTGEDEGGITLQSDVPPLSTFRGPRPPPGTGDHRYTYLLYEQLGDGPLDQSQVAPAGLPGRVNFDLEAFVKANNLRLVGANFKISRDFDVTKAPY